MQWCSRQWTVKIYSDDRGEHNTVLAVPFSEIEFAIKNLFLNQTFYIIILYLYYSLSLSLSVNLSIYSFPLAPFSEFKLARKNLFLNESLSQSFFLIVLSLYYSGSLSLCQSFYISIPSCSFSHSFFIVYIFSFL